MEKISLTWLQYEILKGASDEKLFKMREVIFVGKKARDKISYILTGYGSVTVNSIKKLQYLGLIEEGPEKSVIGTCRRSTEFKLTSQGRRVLMERG